MGDEVLHLLRCVGKGDVFPVLIDLPSAIEIGLVSFGVADWTVRIFFDVGAFDYVDRAISPNGQAIEFGERPENSPDNALQLESSSLYAAMVNAFESATQQQL
ncbi:DUF7693 family protein [Lacipirellula sp.]|uniref:DUF7693 family protein n=1 Tax=Lacipirellula sp. TaxID=2691419 RepID=UPI003D12B75F